MKFTWFARYLSRAVGLFWVSWVWLSLSGTLYQAVNYLKSDGGPITATAIVLFDLLLLVSAVQVFLAGKRAQVYVALFLVLTLVAAALNSPAAIELWAALHLLPGCCLLLALQVKADPPLKEKDERPEQLDLVFVSIESTEG